MRKFLVSGLTGFLLSLSMYLYGQLFEQVAVPFSPAGRSAVAWSDYDRDGDLDLFVSGLGSGDGRVSVLYRNDAGVFSDAGHSFLPLKESAVSWGDYDRDGDQDLLLAGNSENGDVTRIYRNDGDVFTEINPGMVPVQQGDAHWIDLDGDGDLDVFLTGNWFAKVYYNMEGSFTDSGLNFGFFSSSAAAWGDFDRDGDPDLAITGDSGAGAVSKIFRNNSGQFEDIQAGLTGLMAGTADWVDYDNDGDPDLALSGFDDALEARFHLYKNDDGQFQLIYAGIDDFALGLASWGDYDQDGDVDLLMSGKATGCGAYVSGIYRNDGNDLFFKISDSFTTVTRGAGSWADYDNDGDLDFFLCGLNVYDLPFSALYGNNSGGNIFTVNTAPEAPANLTSSVEDDRAFLAWTAADDGQTPSGGLSYNIAIGTAPGVYNISSPMSGSPAGNRFISRNGNAGQCLACMVQDLEPGSYYWSVQAIDQAFAGSAFAEEQVFTITATGQFEEIQSEDIPAISPNPASGIISLRNLPATATTRVVITDLTGRIWYQAQAGTENHVIGIKEYPAGIYLVGIITAGELHSLKLIKSAE